MKYKSINSRLFGLSFMGGLVLSVDLKAFSLSGLSIPYKKNCEASPIFQKPKIVDRLVHAETCTNRESCENEQKELKKDHFYLIGKSKNGCLFAETPFWAKCDSQPAESES